MNEKIADFLGVKIRDPQGRYWELAVGETVGLYCSCGEAIYKAKLAQLVDEIEAKELGFVYFEADRWEAYLGTGLGEVDTADEARELLILWYMEEEEEGTESITAVSQGGAIESLTVMARDAAIKRLALADKIDNQLQINKAIFDRLKKLETIHAEEKPTT